MSADKCASCSHQRRRCPNDCIFRPHFPLSKRNKFEAARRVFGVRNMERMLRDLDDQGRAKAAASMIWEASCWSKDKVNGPLRYYERVINSDRQAKRENWLLRNQVDNLTRSPTTQQEENQQIEKYEQLLKMKGSANDQVRTVHNSDHIGTNYYAHSKESLELQSQGNIYTQCGSVNSQEMERGRILLPRDIGHHGHVAQSPSTPNPTVQAQQRRNLECGQVATPLCSNNPEQIEGGTVQFSKLQPSPSPINHENENHERDVGHGLVAQAPSTPNTIVQAHKKRNLEIHQAASPSFPVNRQETDHGRIMLSLKQLNPFPNQYANETHARDIGLNDHIGQVPTIHKPIAQAHQRRNLEASGHEAFFNTPPAYHHQVSLQPTSYQERSFCEHGQEEANPNIVYAHQMLGHGSANVAPATNMVRSVTNGPYAPYHVNHHNNVRRYGRSGFIEDIVNLQQLAGPSP